MPTLKNPRHEAFAQNYARSGNATKSYVAAGYTGKGPDRCGHRLLSKAEICQRVEEIKQIIADGVIKLEITERSARIAALNDRWNRLRAVIDARANDPTMSDIPGGKTGLMVRQLKGIGSGRDAQVIEEFAVDTGMLKECRAHEQQAAQELGQWSEKQELSTGEAAPFIVQLSDKPNLPAEPSIRE